MTKTYIMKRDGWKDWFELHVSSNQKEMHRNIDKLYKKWGMKSEPLCRVLGQFHPVSSSTGYFGDMFLSEDNLGVGIVAHECLHASMAHERYILRFGMDYGDGLEELIDEERLAYFFTDTVKGVYNTLYENKHIKSAVQ